MKENKALERGILRSFFESAYEVDKNVRWSRYRFHGDLLCRHLRALGGDAVDLAYVRSLSERLGLEVLRVDALKLNIYGFEKSFDRQSIAEGLGSAGVQFFPTRQSASRSAFETAREVAYFSCGDFDSQFMECPLGRIGRMIDADSDIPDRGVILRDLREGFETDASIFDVLARDEYFSAKVRTPGDLKSFQDNLRMNPMSPEFVDKCSDFFNRRATIGVRDTVRWMLGSRHPWFDWQHARGLIESAFEKNTQTDFNTPQIVYYAYDPSIGECDIEDAQAHNECVVEAFAQELSEALRRESPELLAKIESNVSYLSRWILDIHHDYPDFDLESQGCFGPTAHIDFLGHSLQNTFSRDLLGEASQTRRNRNMRAHFAARGIDRECLGDLSDAENETFFAVLDELLEKYDRDRGVHEIEYRRIPCMLFIIQDLGLPAARDNERLLDAFDLSEMTAMDHASHIRMFPEISEKLVVFFALTLRHMIETEHVPDLMPRDFVRDFLLLGLWGIRTPNIHVHLYVDKSLDERDPAVSLTRSEIRFVGTEQVEMHPLEHIREDSKALRFAVAHLAPLIEPSILRNLGTFTMAMEEFRDVSHEFKTDPLSLLHYGMDMVRETARSGIKGSITDALSMFEYLLDSTSDNVQRLLDKTAKMLNRKRAK